MTADADADADAAGSLLLLVVDGDAAAAVDVDVDVDVDESAPMPTAALVTNECCCWITASMDGTASDKSSSISSAVIANMI